MTGAILIAVLGASLAGSLHCAGMCGPFAAWCLAGSAERRVAPGVLQATYHGGRLLVYAALGAAAGLLGAALDLGGAWLGLQRAALVLAGAAMIAAGVVALLRLHGVALPAAPVPRVLRDLAVRGHTAAGSRGPVGRALAVGLLTGLLPCGWLYAFVLVAAGTGAALDGALVMAAFWAGTVPVLAAVGLGAQRLAGPLRRHVPVVTALALVVVGVVALSGRFRVPALSGASVARAAETDGAPPAMPDPSEASCCRPAP